MQHLAQKWTKSSSVSGAGTHSNVDLGMFLSGSHFYYFASSLSVKHSLLVDTISIMLCSRNKNFSVPSFSTPSGPDLTGNEHKKIPLFIVHTFLLKGNTANSTNFKERQTFYFLVYLLTSGQVSANHYVIII